MTSPLLSETAGGWLLVLATVLPIAGVLLAIVAGGRHARRIAMALLPAGLVIAVAIAVTVGRSGEPLVYFVGGWAPPLGVALRADGLSAVMMVTASVVLCAIAAFARTPFDTPPDLPESRTGLTFWSLLIGLSGALNAVFLGNDLFNLYVALELLTFAAVPLVCLDGRAETIAAALRYLLFALIGSALYLLAASLFYGQYGTLDLVLLRGRIHGEPAAYAMAALMTVGLLAKTALFPLHLWLPPAHAGAPPAASAALSALVVKGSFFIVVRLWFYLMPGLLETAAATLLAVLGAGAILVGSALALRQARLKLLIAYSTLAQLGYLFLMFPLAGATAESFWSAGAFTGGILQAVSHAFAKAAMFLAAGLMAEALGHDRIENLAGVGRALPIALTAFALGGLSLLGVPPSGGFAAKWLLLTAAVAEGQWWWALVIVAGGMLAGGYLFRVLAAAMTDPAQPLALRAAIAPYRQITVLALALCSVALGLMPLGPFALIQIGRP